MISDLAAYDYHDVHLSADIQRQRHIKPRSRREYQATFQLQIVPDDTFSGPVSWSARPICQSSPTGNMGSPTTCGISPGSTVSLPFQTYSDREGGRRNSAGLQHDDSDHHQPPACNHAAQPRIDSAGITARAFSPASLLLGPSNGGGTGGAGLEASPSRGARELDRRPILSLLARLLVFQLERCCWTRKSDCPRWHPAFAIACRRAD